MAIVIGILIGLVVGRRGRVRRRSPLTADRGSRRRGARGSCCSTRRAREADALRREAQLEAKEEAVKLRAEIERELQARRAESLRREERLRTRRTISSGG